MTGKPEDFLMQAWKQQLDTGLRMIEALVEGATRLHEIQLEAAADAHADVEATRQALAAADAQRLLQLQAEWTRANLEKMSTYWHDVYQTLIQTNAALAKCMPGAALLVVPGLEQGANGNAFKQWLDSVQRFYQPVEKART